MTVLIVDDYPDAVEVWDLFLTAAGYHVITALERGSNVGNPIGNAAVERRDWLHRQS